MPIAKPSNFKPHMRVQLSEKTRQYRKGFHFGTVCKTERSYVCVILDRNSVIHRFTPSELKIIPEPVTA